MVGRNGHENTSNALDVRRMRRRRPRKKIADTITAAANAIERPAGAEHRHRGQRLLRGFPDGGPRAINRFMLRTEGNRRRR